MTINNPENKLTKKELAESLGVSRSSLYYTRKRPKIDAFIKYQIESVMSKHRSYGHKRIAMELKYNKKRILRVMKKFNLKPYRRRTIKPVKPDDLGKPQSQYQNLIKDFCPIRPNVVWVSDFTFIEFGDGFIYLATIMDLFSREITGWNISKHHDTGLVLGALLDALEKVGSCPIYLHSDQGSEYESNRYTDECKRNRITISMSKKSSPWENGFQESFYSNFKLDLGHVDQFEALGELTEAIHLAINYYNRDRIHTSLKTSPAQFRERYYQNIKFKSCRQSV